MTRLMIYCPPPLPVLPRRKLSWGWEGEHGLGPCIESISKAVLAHHGVVPEDVRPTLVVLSGPRAHLQIGLCMAAMSPMVSVALNPSPKRSWG